jgi:TorA maturation chaperone TorD
MQNRRNPDLAEEERQRAGLWSLPASLLAQPPSSETLKILASLEGDESDLGQALARLGQAAASLSPEQAEDEFNTLFIGVAQGEFLPYASHYLTGFLNDAPLAHLRTTLEALGVTKTEGCFELEDHIAFLCEVMSGLIVGRFGKSADLAAQRHFFDEHMAPWAGQFFTDLAENKVSAFYAAVGEIGGILTNIEREAFAMAA